MNKNAAICLRVSTSDQDYERQRNELLVLAKGLGYSVAPENNKKTNMKRFGLFLIYVFVIFLSLNAQSVTTLNDYFSTYSHKIKTNNFFVTSTSSCIYDTNYMYATQSGKILTLNFGYGWDEKYGYINKCELRIDLSSATFYSGFWHRGYLNNGKWEHCGKKEEITIKDNNGIDLIYSGQQSYNQGTKQDLIQEIKISFGTEPIANRILNEIYAIQANYKGKEPWLLPEPEPEPKPETKKTTASPIKKNPTKGNTKPKSKSSKSGKYVQ